MGSVSSSTGVANLLQILSSTGSSVLNSPGIQSELENASPQDVIEISLSAIQLQGMDTLLGISSTDSTNSDDSALSSIIADMTAAQNQAASASAAPTTSSTASTASTASTTSTDTSDDPLLDVTG